MTWAVEDLGELGITYLRQVISHLRALWVALKMTQALRIVLGMEGAWNPGSQVLKFVLNPESMGQCEPLTHFRAFSLLHMSFQKSFLLKFRKSALPGNREKLILSLLLFYPFKTHEQIDSCS